MAMTAGTKPPGKPNPKDADKPKPWYKRASSWIIAAIITPVLVGVLVNAINQKLEPNGGNGSAVNSATAGPILSKFISSTQRILRVYHVHLDGGRVPEVAITTISAPTAGDGLPPTQDLLVLAWDKYAHRWFLAFDAAKEMGPISFSDPDTSLWPPYLPLRHSVQHAIPFTAGPQGIMASVLHDQPGRRADLLFWSDLEVPDGQVFIIGIVHYDGQAADLAWSFSSTETGTVSIVGSAPHQKVAASTGWETPVDAHCCPIRIYHFVVARTQNAQGLMGPNYSVVSDDRPWLGAYVVAGIGGNPTPTAEVASVVPGSPAAEVLHPMDILTGVLGTKVRIAGAGGPAVMDEFASHHAGDTIQLQIERRGKPETVAVKLTSRASLRAIDASAAYPGPSYFGADAHTLTARLARRGNLPVADGAVISRINTQSSAARAGLAVGDVVTSLDNLPIHDSLDLAAALAAVPPYTEVPISFISPGGAKRTARVIMPIDTRASNRLFLF